MHLADDDIERELHRQSHTIFGVVGLGGYYGPTITRYNQLRPDGWPNGRYKLMDMFGLRRNADGWKELLEAFDLEYPSERELALLSYKEREIASERKPPRCDDDYPDLNGYWTETYIDYEDERGNTWRRTRRTFHIR